MPIEPTVTYLAAALTATFLFQLLVLQHGLKSSRTAASILTYFVFACALGYIVFYGTLLLIPELWPATGGG